jgi:hypothetical protein
MSTQISSPEIGELVKALSKAQGSIKGAKEDSTNPYFKSKYADLSSVWNACKDALGDNGLAVVQTVDGSNDRICLVTTLAHSSGQWMRSYMPIILTKQDPQTLGSAMTYSRRYALAAIVGICPADDDAEAAMVETRKPHVVTIRKDQAEILEKMLRGKEELKEKLLDWAGIKSVADMPSGKFDGAMKAIDNYLKKEGVA